MAEARRHLGELYDQHLITEPAPGRYELHDLLREHARALAAAGDPTGSEAAADRLLDYYLHTALTAGRHIPSWVTAHRRRPDVRWPGDAPDLSTLGRAAAWLEAERPNLRAAVGYAAGSGRHLHAIQIPAAMASFLVARGHWDQASALYQTALTAARQAGDQPGQAGTLHDLGVMGTLTGDYPPPPPAWPRRSRSTVVSATGPARPTPCASRACATLDRQLLRRPRQP